MTKLPSDLPLSGSWWQASGPQEPFPLAHLLSVLPCISKSVLQDVDSFLPSQMDHLHLQDRWIASTRPVSCYSQRAQGSSSDDSHLHSFTKKMQHVTEKKKKNVLLFLCKAVYLMSKAINYYYSLGSIVPTDSIEKRRTSTEKASLHENLRNTWE